jgi:hypothetical protein
MYQMPQQQQTTDAVPLYQMPQPNYMPSPAYNYMPYYPMYYQYQHFTQQHLQVLVEAHGTWEQHL